MSNNTRPGSYDERFVVPLEASRRGAHRARVNPVLAVLPLIAVAAVVAGVILLAYTLLSSTLFAGDGSNTADPGGGTAVTEPAATGSPGQTGAPGADPEASASASRSASPSQAATTSAPAVRVDKSIVLSVFNGSEPAVNGLGRKAAAALKAKGWKHGEPATWQGTDVDRTTIFYSTADQAASARAVRAVLGVGVVKPSPSQAGEGITVVVSNDWEP